MLWALHSNRSGARAVILFLGATLLVSPAFGQASEDALPQAPVKDFTGQPAYEVLRVSAGNELLVRLDGAETAVRLIGTYVPQSGSDADDAQAFTARLLQGESIYLEYDADRPPRDREDRVWAYVYRAPDGLWVNLELVRQGFARVSSAEPFERQKLLQSYERLAQKNHKGLWSPRRAPAPTSRPAAAPTTEPSAQAEAAGDEVIVYVTEHGRKYHTRDCQYVRNGGMAVTLKEARARGCTPCTRCKPPQ
jgi:endonuclease YncB( thermonuclease family)